MEIQYELIFVVPVNLVIYLECNVLVGKPEGKKPLARHRRRWEDNIKMDPKNYSIIFLR
jgi:hypothetical protein